MPDYYVDRATGRDSNPGTLSSPVATITRATELAAEDDRATGIIYIEPGVYTTGEDFPILIPPTFGLEGRGSAPDDCRIEFTGVVMDTSYKGVAVQAGAFIKNISIQAVPPASAPISCNYSIGLMVKVDGCRVENFNVKLSETAPTDAVGFGTGVAIDGVDATATQVHVQDTMFLALDTDAGITDCEVTNGCLAAANRGRMTIEQCRLRNAAICVGTGTEARVERNALNPGWFLVNGQRSPRGGPGPTIRGNWALGGKRGMSCVGEGNSTIEMNVVQASDWALSVSLGASPFFRGNGFELYNLTASFAEFRGRYVLRVGPGCDPAFESNRLNRISRAVGLYHQMFRVAGPADFGGGPRGSAGANTFGIGIATPDFTYPGDIYARNNFWYVLPPVFRKGERTIVHTEGAMLDPGAR